MTTFADPPRTFTSTTQLGKLPSLRSPEMEWPAEMEYPTLRDTVAVEDVAVLDRWAERERARLVELSAVLNALMEPARIVRGHEALSREQGGSELVGAVDEMLGVAWRHFADAIRAERSRAATLVVEAIESAVAELRSLGVARSDVLQRLEPELPPSATLRRPRDAARLLAELACDRPSPLPDVDGEHDAFEQFWRDAPADRLRARARRRVRAAT